MDTPAAQRVALRGGLAAGVAGRLQGGWRGYQRLPKVPQGLPQVRSSVAVLDGFQREGGNPSAPAIHPNNMTPQGLHGSRLTEVPQPMPQLLRAATGPLQGAGPRLQGVGKKN